MFLSQERQKEELVNQLVLVTVVEEVRLGEKGVVEEIIMLAENLRNANGTRVENARFAARHTDAREVQKNVK